MTDFVVGFMREALSDRVLMVRKNKPAWQTGLLNGVGGKVDHQVLVLPILDATNAGKFPFDQTRLETPLEAMVREFAEETGIHTTPDEWRLIMYMSDPRDFYAEDGGTVYWFAATRRFLPKVPPRVLDSGEELTTIRVSDVLERTDVLATVRWAIPMAFLDPTLNVLGSDDDVRANGRAVMVIPKPTIRQVVADTVAKHRGDIHVAKERDDIHAEIRARIEKIAKGVLSPDPRFDKPSNDPGEAMRKYMKAMRKMDAGPVGCKLRYSHRDGAPLCDCADVCMGTGLGPVQLTQALGGKIGNEHDGKLHVEETGEAYKPIVLTVEADPINPRGIKVYDAVVNRSGTEQGKVLAISGPLAWVHSGKHLNKRVSLYLTDLYHAGGPIQSATINGELLVDVARPAQPDQSTIQAERSATRVVRGLQEAVEFARGGVVMVDNQLRAHDGRTLGAVMRDLQNPPARVPRARWAGGGVPNPPPGGVIHDQIGDRHVHDPSRPVDPVNTRSIGPDGHDKVVPHEPLESPDSPHVAHSNFDFRYVNPAKPARPYPSTRADTLELIADLRARAGATPLPAMQEQSGPPRTSPPDHTPIG